MEYTRFLLYSNEPDAEEKGRGKKQEAQAAYEKYKIQSKAYKPLTEEQKQKLRQGVSVIDSNGTTHDSE